MRQLFAMGFAVMSFLCHGQTCLSDALATSPTSRFVINNNGTVTDSVTGLMWMQCSLGQVWDNGACTEDPDPLTWQQALQQAHGFSFAGLDGWRVPNLKELASITERQCVRPSINESVFPATLSDDYWSSTPSMTDPQRAWVVAFFNSSNSIKQKSLFVYARLVRVAD